MGKRIPKAVRILVKNSESVGHGLTCVFQKAPRDEFLLSPSLKEEICHVLPVEICITKFMLTTGPQTEGQAARGCHRLLTLCSEMWA